jgi:hypothetical protein
MALNRKTMEIPAKATHYHVNHIGGIKFYRYCTCGCGQLECAWVEDDGYVDWEPVALSHIHRLTRIKFNFEEVETG